MDFIKEVEKYRLETSWYSDEYLDEFPEVAKHIKDDKANFVFFLNKTEAKRSYINDFFSDIKRNIPKDAWRDVFGDTTPEEIRADILFGDKTIADDLFDLYSEFAKVDKVNTEYGELIVEYC